MSELERFCPAKQQQVIVDSLYKGDRLLADVTYENCVNKIKDENADLQTFHKLERQAYSVGLTTAEEEQRDLKKASGESQVVDLDLKLLQSIKSKQKDDGVCKVDFSEHGNPYAIDTAITCKTDKKP